MAAFNTIHKTICASGLALPFHPPNCGMICCADGVCLNLYRGCLKENSVSRLKNAIHEMPWVNVGNLHGWAGSLAYNVFIEHPWRNVNCENSYLQADETSGALRSGLARLLCLLQHPVPPCGPGPMHPGYGVLQHGRQCGCMISGESYTYPPFQISGATSGLRRLI